METIEFFSQQSIEELIAQFPQIISAFTEYGTACAGCSIAKFCTIKDAIETYNLPSDEFINHLNTLILTEKS